MASRAQEKCKVAGCLGYVEIATDGNGGRVEKCPCCERRAAWERANMPKRTARCVACGAEWEHRGTGKLPSACEACKPIVARAKKLNAQNAARAPKPSIRKIS